MCYCSRVCCSVISTSRLSKKVLALHSVGLRHGSSVLDKKCRLIRDLNESVGVTLLESLPHPVLEVSTDWSRANSPVPSLTGKSGKGRLNLANGLSSHLHLSSALNEDTAVKSLLNGDTGRKLTVADKGDGVLVLEVLGDKGALLVSEGDARPVVEVSDVLVEAHDVHVGDLKGAVEEAEGHNVLRVGVDHRLDVWAGIVDVEVEVVGWVGEALALNNLKLVVDEQVVGGSDLIETNTVWLSPHGSGLGTTGSDLGGQNGVMTLLKEDTAGHSKLLLGGKMVKVAKLASALLSVFVGLLNQFRFLFISEGDERAGHRGGGADAKGLGSDTGEHVYLIYF